MSASTEPSHAGLSSVRAATLIKQHGPNELPGMKPRRLLVLVRDVLSEPMLLLLIAAASIYAFIGDIHEAVALGASMAVVILISILQERRTEHALAKLRELSSPRALVIRDGAQQRIAGRDVTIGDMVVLREGDRVPADVRLLSATALSVDESILTGESLAVDKAPGATEAAQVFSGSLIVRGYGIGEVFAIGAGSRIGQIGKALSSLDTQATPLFKEIRRIVRWVAAAALLLCTLVAVLYGFKNDDWLGGSLAGITLAMGVLPEEFPVVLTLFLALGAWRLGRRGVLTRRLPAIESIGSITILAVDKTGTLTENRMRVAAIETSAERPDLRQAEPLGPQARALLWVATAASKPQAFDPMERAIHEAAGSLLPDAAALQSLQLIREYDLTPQLLAVTHVWKAAQQAGAIVAVKGAPETVCRLCRLSASQTEAQLARVAELASQGLRVLAVARGEFADRALPASAEGFELQFLGLLGLADPLRADVPAALAECTAAGIRVVMITGDHAGTALAIARQAGLSHLDEVLLGSEMASLSDAALCERTRRTCIYARMSPQHKLRLVHAFKANGEVVAMTGDGVNDAPALKAAHIGVAMGQRGTDVAREAAALVLLQDDFASLVDTIRRGRGIYDNLSHAMAFIVAVHIPMAGLGLLPVLFGWPLLLLPLHVLFLEFVIDPACAFVFEADRTPRNIMHHKPRPPNAPLFSAPLLRRSVTLGAMSLALVVGTYAAGLSMLPADQARALAFAALVSANLALILVSRTPEGTVLAIVRRQNWIFWAIAGVTSLLLLACIHLAGVAATFSFAPPPWHTLLSSILGSAAIVLLLGSMLRTRPAAEVAR